MSPSPTLVASLYVLRDVPSGEYRAFFRDGYSELSYALRGSENSARGRALIIGAIARELTRFGAGSAVDFFYLAPGNRPPTIEVEAGEGGDANGGGIIIDLPGAATEGGLFSEGKFSAELLPSEDGGSLSLTLRYSSGPIFGDGETIRATIFPDRDPRSLSGPNFAFVREDEPEDEPPLPRSLLYAFVGFDGEFSLYPEGIGSRIERYPEGGEVETIEALSRSLVLALGEGAADSIESILSAPTSDCPPLVIGFSLFLVGGGSLSLYLSLSEGREVSVRLDSLPGNGENEDEVVLSLSSPEIAGRYVPRRTPRGVRFSPLP